MGPNITCPVCGDKEIEAVLEDVTVVASNVQGDHAVGALVILRCGEGHIFFVRQADLQTLAA